MTRPIDLGPILPELILAGSAIVVLLGGVIARGLTPFAWVLSLAGWPARRSRRSACGTGTARLTVLAGGVTDRFGVATRLIILAVAAIGLLLGHHYFERSGEQRREFAPLMLFATTGMTLLRVSADLIVAFLALEILSLSLYVMTGLSRRLGSVEGAMKYFLLGAFSSAFFLFGIAMAYGATGSTQLDAISGALADRVAALAVTAMGSSPWASGSRSRPSRSTCGRRTSTRAPRRP